MSNQTLPNLTLPEGIKLPQQNPLAALLGGLGGGISAGAAEGLKQQLLLKKTQAEATQKQGRTNKLATLAGIDPASVQGLDPADLSQFIRSKAEEDKAKARIEAGQTKEEQKFAFKRLETLQEKARVDSEEIPLLKTSLKQMEFALANKDLGFISLDNLAEMTGIKAFRTPEGALFKSAAKTFFLGDLAGVKARPNLFLQKVLIQALPMVGRSNEANSIVTKFLQNKINLLQLRRDSTDSLSDDIASGKMRAPLNPGSIVNKRAAEAMNKLEAGFEQEMRAFINKNPLPDLKKDFTRMIGPKGEDKFIRNDQVEAARRSKWRAVR